MGVVHSHPALCFKMRGVLALGGSALGIGPSRKRTSRIIRARG